MAFFQHSTLLKNADLLEEASCLTFTEQKLGFFEVLANAYFASVCADFIRRKLLENRISFTFETVMSAADKIEDGDLKTELTHQQNLLKKLRQQILQEAISRSHAQQRNAYRC